MLNLIVSLATLICRLNNNYNFISKFKTLLNQSNHNNIPSSIDPEGQINYIYQKRRIQSIIFKSYERVKIKINDISKYYKLL